MEWLLKFLPLLSTTAGDGGDTGGDGGGGSQAPASEPLTDAQLEERFNSFLAKRNVTGDGNAAAMAVFREFYPDNYNLRQERNALKTQLESTQGKVLGDDDTALLSGVKELNLDLDGIKALQASAQSAAESQRELTTTRIAQAGGYDADVLGTLLNGREPQLAADADPKKLESYTVKIGDADKPLKDWLEQDNAKFMPSLVLNGKAQPPKAPAGSGSAGGATDYVSSYLNRKKGADTKGS